MNSHNGNALPAVILLLTLALLSAACADDPAKEDSPSVVGADASSSAPGRSLGIESVPNLRDLGGYKTVDGMTVALGLAYRSNQLNPISPDDLEKMADLGLVNSYDLRTEAERTANPDELPPGVENVWLNVLADHTGAGPAKVAEFLQNPQEANAEFGGGKIEELFKDSYREFVTLPSAQAAFRELFLSLGDRNKLPGLFHCTTGKDRTGWAAAALLTLLGVPKETVMEDFLRSNDYILPLYQEKIDAFVSHGGESAIIRAILGVHPEYLEASFDEMEMTYGPIEGYFSEALGIDAAAQKALRDLYLAPVPSR